MGRSFTRVVTTPAAARRPHDGSRPFVSLTSDWGMRDPSPAICRAVVLGIAPAALIVDITHEVDKYNIRHGALMLWCALPFLPTGAHVCVVDPGVGTARRPVALETARGDYLIGPDNGVLLPGADRLGGVTRAHEIENTQYRLPIVSSTFHGRDIFSPAAAHLALGVPLEALGRGIDPQALVRTDWPSPVIGDDTLQTSVIYRDTFGNLKLGCLASQLAQAFPELRHGETLFVKRAGSRAAAVALPWAATFGEVSAGECLLYEDSYGRVCIAQNQGNAAEALRLDDGSELRLTRTRPVTAKRAGHTKAA
jgi:S-adenosylmethionine hydrolase